MLAGVQTDAIATCMFYSTVIVALAIVVFFTGRRTHGILSTSFRRWTTCIVARHAAVDKLRSAVGMWYRRLLLTTFNAWRATHDWSQKKADLMRKAIGEQTKIYHS